MRYKSFIICIMNAAWFNLTDYSCSIRISTGTFNHECYRATLV